jgi:lipoprotein-anchoring transpeptidase ErfK/SrfK
MKYKFILFLIIALILPIKITAEEDTSNNIYLYLTEKKVCSNRANKCWPVAIGRTQNKTPNLPGPHYVLTKYTNGFIWKNPFTGQVFPKGKHNLGNIWIHILTTKEGIDIGFHQTPEPNIPLNKQESLGGCVRMHEKDIEEFVKTIHYLDEIHIKG